MLEPRARPYLVWYHFKTISDMENLISCNASILDLGCGEGLFLKEIRNGSLACGLDLSKNSLKQAMMIVSGKFWVLADAAYLPFQDSSFHIVVSHQLVEHVAKRDEMISEVSRILKPDGTFIITTPVKKSLGNILARSKNIFGEKVLSPDHVSEYKSEEEAINSVLEASHYSLELKAKERRSVQLPFARLLPWFYNRGFLGPMLPLYFYYDDLYLIFSKISDQTGRPITLNGFSMRGLIRK